MKRRSFLSVLGLAPLALKTVWQTTDPYVPLPPHCGATKEVVQPTMEELPITRYDRELHHGELVQLIHPYDLHELLIDWTKDLSLVQTFYKLEESVQEKGLIRLDGRWYKQSTDYPPATKRFA